MKMKIAKICSINNKSLSASDKYEFINYLDTSSLTEGRIYSIQKLVIGVDLIPSRAKRIVQANDILISTVRPRLKHYGIIKKPYENMIVSTGFAVLTPNTDFILPEYLYYVLTQPKITNYLSVVADGSTTAYPSITPSIIGSLEIEVPDILTQQEIVDRVAPLDSQISVFNELNDNYQEMSQLLFRKWFIEYDFPNLQGKPYKSNGGKMVEREGVLAPESWICSTFSHYSMDIISGDWGLDEATEEESLEAYCIRGTDIPSVLNGQIMSAPVRYFSKECLEVKKLRENDIVVEMSGGSPTQSTGRTIFISKELIDNTSRPIVCSNFCKIIRFSNAETAGYFFEVMRYYYNKKTFFLYEGMTSGIKNLLFNSFITNQKAVIPDDKTISLFSVKVRSLMGCAHLNGASSDALSELRDLLIKKLIQ